MGHKCRTQCKERLESMLYTPEGISQNLLRVSIKEQHEIVETKSKNYKMTCSNQEAESSL